MSKNRLRLKEDENGFVFSGLALLLLLPALLISSTYLVAVEQGGETVSAQNMGDKVLYTSMRVENTIVRMNFHNMEINESTLKQRERNYKDHTGLLIDLSFYRKDGVLDRFPRPENNENFVKSYEFWDSSLEVEVDNTDSLAITALVIDPSGDDDDDDDGLETSDNIRVEAENFSAWVIVEDEDIVVEVVRDDGKRKVEEGGNIIEIMVRDQLGVAESKRTLNLWKLNY